MKIYLILFSSLISNLIIGQNLSAYIDYKNYFYVYDDGPTKEMEYQPIKSFKVGANAVAYINGTDNFKAYYNGLTYNLLETAPSDYYATNKFVAYYKNKILSVFDNGKIKDISKYTDNYAVGDSIVGVFDQSSSTFRAYYNGTVQELEIMIGQTSYTDFKAGANILAYINYDNRFKIFYHQKVIEMESNPPISYQAGASIVAYVDGYTQLFKVFVDGNTYTLENLPPTSYKIANNMVAYVDNSGSFKIFYQGQTYTVNPFEPTFYEANDKIVVYFDGTYFSAFYKGNITQLERYTPEKYQADYNHLAYMDNNGYLKALYDGELKQISKEKINSFDLTGNVLKFNYRLTDVVFFCKGKYAYH